MSAYKEFTGKTLDEAIKEACAFFNVEREKLEIEIVNDAKTGIFGLVGAKKATVRARKVSLDDIGLTFPAKDEKGKDRGSKKDSPKAGSKAAPKPEGKSGQGRAAAPQAGQGDAPAKPGRRQPAREAGREAERDSYPEKPAEGTGERTREPSRNSAKEAKKQPPAGSLASRRAADPAFTPEDAAETSLAIRPQNLPAVDSPATTPETGPETPAEARSRSKGRGRGKGRDQSTNGATGGSGAENRQPRDKQKNPPKGGRQRSGDSEARQRPEAEAAQPFNEDDGGFEDQLPLIPLEELDQELLRQTVLDTLQHLVTPLADGAESSLSIEDGRVRVRLETAENQGLLIGRDGQTLSALQYLLSCIISRQLGASVRVQIDAGDYREKQEEKLRSLALSLALKVKNTQRPQSTRPLSAYHRRIIHVTLQDDPDVQTHSKSEGNLKSVVIVPRRKNSSK